jgi:hypothetical protein
VTLSYRSVVVVSIHFGRSGTRYAVYLVYILSPPHLHPSLRLSLTITSCAHLLDSTARNEIDTQGGVEKAVNKQYPRIGLEHGWSGQGEFLSQVVAM